MSSAVPAGWNTVSLAEGIDILSGYPFDSSSFTDDSSKTGLIRIRDLVRQKVATYFDGAFDDNYLIRKGDVLIGMDGDFNIVKWNSAPSLLNQRICKVTVAGEIFDLAYLYQDLQKDLLEINNQTGSTTVKHLSVKDIRGIHKSYPPLPEQKKIASILTSVDEVVENTQKQIDKLQDLKKATMNELLTKGIGHTEFKDSELGRIPKSWEVVQLEELLSDLTYGLTVRPKYQSLGVPLVSGKECKNGWIDFSIANLISEDDFVGLRQRGLPKVGDVLFTKTGTLGRIAVVKAEYPKFALSQNVALLTPDFNVVVPKFLAYLCESESIKQQTKLGASTLSVQDLQLGIMRKFRVPKVPIDEQYNIIKVIDALGLRLDRVERKLSQTQSLKKSLMQDLLTGKVRVTVN